MRRSSFLFVALLAIGSLGAFNAQADPSGGPVTNVEPPPPKVTVQRNVRIEPGQTFVNSGYTVSFGCCNCGGGVGGTFGGSAYTMPTEVLSGVTITVGG